MKVIFHEDFYTVYTSDPAAAPGRMEAVVNAIAEEAEYIDAQPATAEQIAAVHSQSLIQEVRELGLFEISALAAGGALQAARIGLEDPCFGLIRPPGHHASSASHWGFCFFNNMAIALTHLKRAGHIHSAFVLDFDLHYGDGNVNILEKTDFVTVFNAEAHNRTIYLTEVRQQMETCDADMIGISAGFDNHREDWGGLLETEDYQEIGTYVRRAAERNGRGYFAILEGGYNHDVLGQNVLALMRGMSGK